MPAPAPSASRFTGKTLGRCRIGRPVGRGGTATVFHALYEPLKRDVAVKVLRPDAAATPELRERFLEEAKALARLDHPNVVRVFDVVEDGGFLLIIMDFVKGENLLTLVDEEGPLDPETAVLYARQVAEALDHAHSHRILHRDVKPGNVIHDEGERVVLVDFGNAERVGTAGDRKGTAHYVAPEVFQGKRQDEKCDTYSLGATLFHLLTGEPPYGGATLQEILKAHEAGKLRTPSSVNPEGGIPRALDDLVKRAMAPARGYRFLARELVAAIDEVLPVIRSGPKRPRARRGRAARAAARKGAGTGALIAAAAALVLVGIGVAVAVTGKEPEKAPTPVVVEKQESAPAPEEKKTLDPGFDKRASGREAREAAASKAFQEAQDFASDHTGEPLKVAERYASVASEYGEYAAGRRAAVEEKAWREKALSSEERTAREAARKEEERKAAERRTQDLERVADLVGRMQFSQALGLLEEIPPGPDDRAEWGRRKRRLNLLIGFQDLIATALEGQALSLAIVAPSVSRPGEEVAGAGEGGILVRSATGSQRMVPWEEMKAEEVVALCRKAMRNQPEERLSLATWCWERGLERDARKEMDTALLTDRTGTVSGRIEELFGPME